MRGLYVEQQSIGSSLRTRLAVYRLYVEDCFYVYLSLSTSIQHQPFFSFLFWFNSRKCVLTFMYFLRYFLYPLAEPHSTSLRSDSITPIKEIIFPVWMEDTGWTCYTAAEKYRPVCKIHSALLEAVEPQGLYYNQTLWIFGFLFAKPIHM